MAIPDNICMRQKWIVLVSLAFLSTPTLARSIFTLGGVPLDLTLIKPRDPLHAEQPANAVHAQQQQQEAFNYANQAQAQQLQQAQQVQQVQQDQQAQQAQQVQQQPILQVEHAAEPQPQVNVEMNQDQIQMIVMQKLIDKQREKILEQHAKLQGKDQEIRQQVEQLQQMFQENKRLEHELQLSVGQNAQLQLQIQQLNSDLGHMQQIMEEAQAEFNKMQEQNRRAEAEKNQLLGQYQQLQGQYRKLELDTERTRDIEGVERELREKERREREKQEALTKTLLQQQALLQKQLEEQQNSRSGGDPKTVTELYTWLEELQSTLNGIKKQATAPKVKTAEGILNPTRTEPDKRPTTRTQEVESMLARISKRLAAQDFRIGPPPVEGSRKYEEGSDNHTVNLIKRL